MRTLTQKVYAYAENIRLRTPSHRCARVLCPSGITNPLDLQAVGFKGSVKGEPKSEKASAKPGLFCFFSVLAKNILEKVCKIKIAGLPLYRSISQTPKPFKTMEAKALKSAIENALDAIQPHTGRKHVSVYSDGSISPVLQQGTWEEKKGVFEVTRVLPFAFASDSANQIKQARREEKKRALAQAEETLSIKASL